MDLLLLSYAILNNPLGTLFFVGNVYFLTKLGSQIISRNLCNPNRQNYHY